MYIAFIYCMDPTIFLKDSDYTFSQKEVDNIAELADEYAMNDSCFREILEKYNRPFWYISSSYDRIKLETHGIFVRNRF